MSASEQFVAASSNPSTLIDLSWRTGLHAPDGEGLAWAIEPLVAVWTSEALNGSMPRHLSWSLRLRRGRPQAAR